MGKINDTDAFLVNRSDKTYQLQADSLMAELLDDDYMLINRSDQTYKVSGADIKDSLAPVYINKPSIIAPTQNATPDADTLTFVGSIPDGPEVVTWAEARWEVSEDNFTTTMVDLHPIINSTSTQELTFDDRINIRLEPETTYQVRLRYTSSDPLFASEYSDVISFTTAESLDGWEIVNEGLSSFDNIRKIVYGEPSGTPTYVAIGNVSYYSYDLINWNKIIVDRPETQMGAMMDCVYANNRFVAVGVKSSPTQDGNTMYSLDGINWAVSEQGAQQVYWALAYGNNTYVALSSGGPNGLMYSTDNGVSWTDSTELGQQYYSSILFDGGKFIANGNSYYLQYSINGIDWTQVDWPGNQGAKHFGIDDSTNYVGLANDYTFTSVDGINWTIESSPKDDAWAGVAYGDSKFVAVGRGGPNPVMYSTDKGDTWTLTPAPVETWQDVIYDGNQFVAIAINGKVMVSKTGIGRAVPAQVSNRLSQYSLA